MLLHRLPPAPSEGNRVQNRFLPFRDIPLSRIRMGGHQKNSGLDWGELKLAKRSSRLLSLSFREAFKPGNRQVRRDIRRDTKLQKRK